jgi:serine/threonine protein kinase
MWGVGCIFHEMLTHKAMFTGQSTVEQLNLIFQLLGTPTAEDHPTLTKLPLFEMSNFKKHKAKTLLWPPRIDSQRADLLNKMLQYEGRSRISALDAMRHPFLSCFSEEIFDLADTESVLKLPGVRYVHEPTINKMGINHSSSKT